MKPNPSLTEGPILRSLITLSIPIIFANILQTAYQLTDTFWVGRLGTEAVAAVSISFPIIFLIISLGGGLAMAGTILVAQYYGKKDHDMVNHVTTQTFLIVTIVSLILSSIGYYFSPVLINIMHAESNTYSMAVSYMQITFIGMIFMFSFMVFQSLMRGIGEVKAPMLIVLGTVLLNLILDPLFIFGYGIIPAFGVTGAAIATIGTQSLATIIGLTILIKGKFNIRLLVSNLKPDTNLLWKMTKLGFPASIEQSTRALNMTIITFLAASFGDHTLAAYGIGSRILSFVIIPALGFSMATSTLVGQNIGAEKLDRAEETIEKSLLISFAFLTIIGIIFFIFAQAIAALFIPGDIETIEKSALMIQITSLTFGLIGVQMTFNGVFRGAGNTLAAMFLSIIILWFLQFPLALFLSKFTELQEVGIWLSFPIANIFAALITYLWFKTGKWKHRKLTETIKLTKETSQEAIIEEGIN